MLKKLFKSKLIKEEEKEFFIKANKYLIKNCNAVYGSEYIPRLVQRICKAIGIYVECHKGVLTIIKDNKIYDISHAYNIYKGQVIDLGLFVVKECYKAKEYDNNIKNCFREKAIFSQLPSFIISGVNNSNLPKDITYQSKEIILNKDFQPATVMKGDELILAVYNNSIAYSIAHEILEFQPEKDNFITPNIGYMVCEDFRIKEL